MPARKYNFNEKIFKIGTSGRFESNAEPNAMLVLEWGQDIQYSSTGLTRGYNATQD